jgi:hypothetical protein
MWNRDLLESVSENIWWEFVSNSAIAKSHAQLRNEDEEENTSLKRVLSAGIYKEVFAAYFILDSCLAFSSTLNKETNKMSIDFQQAT